MINDGLHQAEQKADRIRGELFRSLDELDRRRHEALDWRTQLHRNWRMLAGAAGVIGALVTARLLFGRVMERRRVNHLGHERREAIRRFWEHPERVAPTRHAGPVEWGMNALGIFGTAIASRLSRRVARQLVG
ncbi:MAG TPA: hypothetical protein VE618_04870 [Myxococcaceae bacterium]|nr:hypothetical protein [Myxococcaceae bacterium]